MKDSWTEVQGNMGKLQGLFKGNMVIVDNSKDFPEGRLQLPKFVYSVVKQFVKKPVKNAKGKKWITRALDMKRSV